MMTSSAGGSGRVTDEEDWTTVGDGDTAEDGGVCNGVLTCEREIEDCGAVGDGNTDEYGGAGSGF